MYQHGGTDAHITAQTNTPSSTSRACSCPYALCVMASVPTTQGRACVHTWIQQSCTRTHNSSKPFIMIATCVRANRTSVCVSLQHPIHQTRQTCALRAATNASTQGKRTRSHIVTYTRSQSTHARFQPIHTYRHNPHVHDARKASMDTF